MAPEPMFRSWMMGGFEGATMLFESGRRADVVERSAHGARAGQDYALLAAQGIRTIRDAFRWHLIELKPGVYDWSSVLPMLRAARVAEVQVIWDLCHFGLPDWIDPWSSDLVDRFAAFARAAAELVSDEGDDIPFWCPVNEISYWAFAGGDKSHFHPFGSKRGAEWKRQLVRMAVAGARAVRQVDPRARLVHTDPVIHVAARNSGGRRRAEGYRRSMFEAWDMIGGLRDPDLGGSPDCLDIIGVNFYADNEWIDEGPRLRPHDPLYRPLHEILAEVAGRYGRPMIISETGAESVTGPGWLRLVLAEVEIAARAGTTVEGLCLYPVMDYPGWTDDRHCRCGVIAVAKDWSERSVDAAMTAVVADASAPGTRLGSLLRTSP